MSSPIVYSPPDLPSWLKRPLPAKGEMAKLKASFRQSGLHTVCESARCPNIGECFSSYTATFMINGNVCTRACRFCDVKTGSPSPLDPDEGQKLAASAKGLGLQFVVITSVNRDDLSDGGASGFVNVAHELRKAISGVKMEFLIPDFNGEIEPLSQVMEALPTVLNHNLETVERLTPLIRSKARYRRSLELLSRAAKDGRFKVKTGVMLGLGEKDEDLIALFDDVAKAGVHILTLGQYLSPGPQYKKVDRYLPPEDFDRLKELAQSRGLPVVQAGPFVRSSYRAGELSK